MVDGWMHGEWEGEWLVIKEGRRVVRIRPAPGTVIESTRGKQGSTLRHVHRPPA